MLHRHAAAGRPPRRRFVTWKHLAPPAVLAVAVGTVAMVGLPSRAATAPPAGEAYQLKVEKSGMCLDVPKASTGDGALVQQWGCTDDSPWQQFTLVATGGGRYQLVNVNSGKCLDVPGRSTTSGERVQQWSCGDARTNQLWTLTPRRGGTFQIISEASGLCLSDKGASTDSGTPIIQETCTNNSNKRWTFSAVGAARPAPAPSATTTAPTTGGKPTVAADGTGTYRTVQAAVDAVPANNTAPVTITIKPGTYREKVTVPSDKPFVTLRGLGSSPDQVVIVRNVSAGQAGNHLGSATVVARGHDFTATDLTISNDFDESTTTSGQQAPALYLDSDRSVLRNVRLLADQDTFLLNDNARSYVVDSYIEGTVDFIYGGGTAVLDRCTIYEKRAVGGAITAASTDAAKKYGFLIYRSTIGGARAGTVQLGRPWRQGAQVLYRESTLSDLVTSRPWTDMGDATWQKARFLEYRNTGSGATVNGNRPQLSDSQAADYTPQKYLAGSDGWNPMVSTPATATTATTTTPAGTGRAWSDSADGFASTGGGTTGGAAGGTVTVKTYEDLVRYATATDPYVIRVAGTLTATDYGDEIRVASNKTIIGVGTTGELVNGGLFLGAGVHNVIVRNMTIRDTRMTDDDPDDKLHDFDGIQLDTADHVWIDHNRIVRMNDGLIDSRKDTTYLTVSWNELGEGNKAFGIGWTTNVTSRITIHHNWIHDTGQRNPSIDNVALAHLYDNYLQNVTGYGNYSRGSSKTVIENSYYDGVRSPYYRDGTAALTQSGSIVVNCTGKQQTGGDTFDPRTYYAYTLDPAEDVPTLVRTYAGPQADIGG